MKTGQQRPKRHEVVSCQKRLQILYGSPRISVVALRLTVTRGAIRIARIGSLFCDPILGSSHGSGSGYPPFYPIRGRLYLISQVKTIRAGFTEWYSKFPFPMLDALLQTWAGLYDSLQYESDFKDMQWSGLEMPIHILDKALHCGHAEAYRIFRDEGWMVIIFTEWVICGGSKYPAGDFANPNQVITGCIKGLYNLTPYSNGHKFCEYLHQPQQLVLGFMLIVAASAERKVALDECRDCVIRLATLCPTHTSWRECYMALKAILVWAQMPNSEISLFPWPSSLEYLSTTVAFRKYPLVDWTARRFSSPQMREYLELGLGTLHSVLEYTRLVSEGVLIPVLENQMSIEAVLPAESQISASDTA
ncbi:hypothetical protein BDZ89DRAFT_1051529 [Hymenopellis radicata]|nr:hypothetical protein BDZ89DRAFT_1051529 [Hymenopellis radicata]